MDRLSHDQLEAVRNPLEVMIESLSRSLAQAGIEDEEITPETAALDRGEGIPHDDILREFGLKA